MEKTRAAVDFPCEPPETGDVLRRWRCVLEIKAERVVPFSSIGLEDLPIFESRTFRQMCELTYCKSRIKRFSLF